MTFLCHNNTIRSVFYDSSHLRYRRQQREICHYLHERDGGFVIIERASLVITSLCWNINAARRHGEQRPTEETQILIWRLEERVFFFFLGDAFIARAHLPEPVDRKFARSAQMITLFLPLLPPPPLHPES